MMLPSRPGWSYRVDHRPGYFLPHLGLLLFPACFGLGAAGSQGGQRVGLFVVAAVLTTPMGPVLWVTVRSFTDKLTIYPDEGFEYRRWGRVHAFRWDDIADVTYAETPDRRLVATGVIPRAGGEFRFARRMLGLDLLGQEYADWMAVEEDDDEQDEEEPEDDEQDASDQDLGPIVGIYRVRNGCTGFLIVGAVASLAGLTLLFVIAEPGIGSLICFAPFGIATAVLVWGMVTNRNDELTIYQNGFTYRDRKGTQQCLWEEIEDFRMTSNGVDLVALKKMDGPWISFAGAMTGMDQLKPHRQRMIPWVGRPDGRP
jgi:hypothetical protein